MSAGRAVRSPWNVCKRLKTTPCRTAAFAQRATFTTTSTRRQELERAPDGEVVWRDAMIKDITDLATQRGLEIPKQLREALPDEASPRLPKNLLALYAAPIRREPTHGIVVCDLQLRSYDTGSVEVMADFAMRAAYYLNLPAKGPVPLPRIVNRWTVPKDHFIFKKVQENWERKTLRRLVQIQDGHPDVVQVWLSFIRKYCYYGVGLKANVYEHEGVGVAERMDKDAGAIEAGLESADWAMFETNRGNADPSKFGRLLSRHGLHAAPRDPIQREKTAKNQLTGKQAADTEMSAAKGRSAHEGSTKVKSKAQKKKAGIKVEE